MINTMTGAEVLDFRTRHNLGQHGLAELIGVTWQAVKLWETDKRKVPPTTARLLRLFDKFPQLLTEF